MDFGFNLFEKLEEDGSLTDKLGTRSNRRVSTPLASDISAILIEPM